MSNTISIIIIGYNSQNELTQCLDSLKKIKPSESLYEIIYIDVGSIDDSDNVFKKATKSILSCSVRFRPMPLNFINGSMVDEYTPPEL